jgi:Flp pilus assembly protein TadD
MANGLSLPQKARVEIFDGDHRLASSELGARRPKRSLDLPPGDYRVQISGNNTSYVFAGHVHVDPIQPCFFNASLQGRSAMGGMTDDDVDVEDLRVSAKARSVFSAAFKALERGELQPAKNLFLEVTELAPNLSRTYNVLGVISDQQGDKPAAERYFEKALALNPRSQSSKLNLAKLFLSESQYHEGLTLLNQFGATENTDVLAMKAQANLQLGHLEEAIKQAHAVHLLPHAHWASIHVIAAQAYERMHQPELARAEYQMYMRESPNGDLRVAASRRMRELGSSVVSESSTPDAPPINSLLPR